MRRSAAALRRSSRRAGLAPETWVLPLAVAGAGSSACVEADVPQGPAAAPLPGVAELGIDTGAGLVLEPGVGIGVGLEYAGEGRWDLTTVCDTLISQARCAFDVLLTSPDGAAIAAFEGLRLEAGDVVGGPDPFTVQLDLLTESESDGVTLVTEPGAALRVSALFYDPVLVRRFVRNDDHEKGVHRPRRAGSAAISAPSPLWGAEIARQLDGDGALDAARGWSDDPRIISWVGGGAVHWGAPTNPVDLRPNRP